MKNNRSTYAVKKEIRGGAGAHLRPILISLGISVGVFVFLVFVSAIYSCSLDDPEKYLLLLGMFSLFSGALCAGFFGAKFSEKGIFVGLLCGACYTVLALLLRFVMFGGDGLGLFQSLGIYITLIGASLVGAVVGNYRPDPAKKRRNKMKKFAD